MFYSKQNPLKFFLEQSDPPGGGSGSNAGGNGGGTTGGSNNPAAGGSTDPGSIGNTGNTGSAAGAGSNNTAGSNINNTGPKSVFDANTQGQDGQGGNPAPVVPESYEFNIGEGLTITDELKERFTTIAKGAKLSQEQADALIKMHSDIMLDQIKQTEERVNGWVKECEKQGYLSQENLGYAKSAINYFGGSDAMNALVETGAINHPAVFKMVMTIGQLIAEDAPPKGDPPKGPKSSADILFPNSKYD